MVLDVPLSVALIFCCMLTPGANSKTRYLGSALGLGGWSRTKSSGGREMEWRGQSRPLNEDEMDGPWAGQWRVAHRSLALLKESMHSTTYSELTAMAVWSSRF